MQNHFLLVYLTVAAIVLGLLALFVSRRNEIFSQKTEKIRLSVDERRHGRVPEPQEDDFDKTDPIVVLLFGAMILLILFLYGAS